MCANKAGTQERERRKSLYFTDGNVVLFAPRPEKSGLLFRVHKSVLSSHSPIFADMFSVCNPPSKGERETDHLYDGAPLVHLSDNADHLGSVLEVLYYQSDLPVPRSPHFPSLITPILELARKYGIDRMYAQIVRNLERDWPQTLKDWDALEREVSFIKNDLGVDRIDDHLPEPASVIQLARQFDIPGVLPSAFYHLSRLSVLDDWDKIHADPSLQIRNPTQRTARWGLLSAEELHCLLLGKAELADFLCGCINTKDFQHVTSIVSRREVWCEVAEGLWKDILDRCLQSADPLALLKVPVDGEKAQRCHICANALRAKMLVVRAQVWEKLEDLFHLKVNLVGKTTEVDDFE